MHILTYIILCGLTTVGSAQTTSPSTGSQSPVNVSRVPPKGAQNLDPLESQLSADLQALQGAVPPIALPNLAAPTASRIEGSAVPKDFHPRPDMPLTPIAQAAVKVSEKWLTELSTPSVGPDGRVVYTYGGGLPTVVCAPL